MITQLELTTLTFVANAVLAYVIWLDKPFGVERSETFIGSTLRSSEVTYISSFDMKSVSDLKSQELLSRDQFRNQRIRNSGVLRLLLSPFHADNDWIPILDRIAIFAFYVMGALTTGIQLIAWNWDFPSPAARLSWRIFSLLAALGILIPISSFAISRIHRTMFRTQHYNNSFPLVNFVLFLLTSVWENLIYVWVAIYAASRVAIFALSLYCLSSLPASAYQSVDWTKYLPHFS
jgi:hypothetical protein